MQTAPLNMQIAALKVFCDVARHRSFSQAAQANGVTQSAVSQVVSQLEKRMGVQLVDRSTRPLHLTQLGQTYYEGCKTLLDRYQELEASIRNARTEVAGGVQVAAIYSVGLGDIQHYEQRFRSDHPQATVHIDYLHPDQVYEHVLQGTADLGLVSFPRKSPKLSALAWRDEEMVLACAPSHPLADRTVVTLKELRGQKYVHFDRNLTIRRKVDRFLRQQGVVVDVVLEFDNIENIKQAVAIDAGVALLPEPTLRREVKSGALVRLPLQGCRLTRPLGIIHRRQHLSAAARCFLELLLEESALERTPERRNGFAHASAAAPATVGRPHVPIRSSRAAEVPAGTAAVAVKRK